MLLFIILYYIIYLKYSKMLRSISKILLITTPAFVACHLINENTDVARKYCPVVKFKTPENKNKNESENTPGNHPSKK